MKHRWRLILFMILGTQPPGHAEPEALGRLFLTPVQRAELNRQRQQNPAFLANAPSGQSRMTLNGEVRRHRGHTTRWINGKADWDGQFALPIPVGDTLDLNTGERKQLLGAGQFALPAKKVR